MSYHHFVTDVFRSYMVNEQGAQLRQLEFGSPQAAFRALTQRKHQQFHHKTTLGSHNSRKPFSSIHPATKLAPSAWLGRPQGSTQRMRSSNEPLIRTGDSSSCCAYNATPKSTMFILLSLAFSDREGATTASLARRIQDIEFPMSSPKMFCRRKNFKNFIHISWP